MPLCRCLKKGLSHVQLGGLKRGLSYVRWKAVLVDVSSVLQGRGLKRGYHMSIGRLTILLTLRDQGLKRGVSRVRWKAVLADVVVGALNAVGQRLEEGQMKDDQPDAL